MAMAAAAAAAVVCSSLELGRCCLSMEALPASFWCKQLCSASRAARLPMQAQPRTKLARKAAAIAAVPATGDWKEQAELIASTLDTDGLEEARGLFVPSRLTPVFIGGVIKRSKRPGAALELFTWAQQQDGYRHDVYSYNCALAALVIDKESLAMLQLFKQMEAEGVQADKDTYSLLVRGLCRCGDIDQAWKLLQEMISKGHVADSLTCGNLVERFCGVKRVNEACLVFQELETHGVSIGMLAYNAILRTILSSGDLDGGFKFSGQLVEGGCLPHILAYKTILDCLIRTGRTREASDVVGDMIKNSVPDVTTYTAVISVLCKHNRSEDAMRVFNMMVDMELPPSSEVYTALLLVHCRRKKLDVAYKIFVEMVERGCSPNSSAYGLLLRCLCNGGKFHIAYDIHRSMASRGAPLPDESTYTSLVAAACSLGETDRARQLFEEADSSSQSSSPTLVESRVHNALVEGLCRTSKVEEAFEFTASMVARGWTPTMHTYNALIMGFFRVSQPDRAAELFSAMKQRGYAPNAAIYTTLVAGLCRAGKVEEARNAFDEARDGGTVPGNVACNLLVRALVSVGRENEAREIYSYMSDLGYAPDRSTRNLLEQPNPLNG